MTLLQFYHQKHVLLTGTTGFIGKVLLFRFLKSVASVDKIYLLVRTKKGSSVEERINREIFGSECFDGMKKELGD